MQIFRFRKANAVAALLWLLPATGAVFAQNRPAAGETAVSAEIVFQSGKWEEVVSEAKKSGKYIFVDAYTTWCVPCKLLKSTTFRDKNAAVFFNKNFINYQLDMEKGEGVALAEKWDVSAYPSLLFFTPGGELVLKQIGYIDGPKLNEVGKQALKKRS